MTLAAALLAPFKAFRTERPQPAPPEPLRVKQRPTVGLWAKLTDEQRAMAVAYDGKEAFGDPDFGRNH